MALTDEEMANLLSSPRETLQIELKQWIDPSSPEGIAKIAKGCLALRNNNGGVLVIGIRNDGHPDTANMPADALARFHVDVIQKIVADYSSDPFAIEVQFGLRDGAIYPIISVPPGVRTPIAAKRDLPSAAAKSPPLIKDHAVYVRSISGNNTVSSTEARRGDWDRLVQVCFDNREADIGNFVRRHLSSANLGMLGSILASLNAPPQPAPTEIARAFLMAGRKRYSDAVMRRGENIPDIGFRETAVVVNGAVPDSVPTDSFLQRLFVAQPQHTGWPAWVDSRGFAAKENPVVLEGAWQALVSDNGFGPFQVPHVTFWIIDPKGKFYLLTGLEDDLPLPSRAAAPGKSLEFLLQIARISEIISVALSFGRSLGCDPTKTSLTFSFRWSRLSGRTLASWANQRRQLFHRGMQGVAHQDEFTTDLTVPLDLPPSAIAPHVEGVIRPLFALFDGREFHASIIADIVEKSLRGMN